MSAVGLATDAGIAVTLNGDLVDPDPDLPLAPGDAVDLTVA
jgi:hypothetical protein